MSVCAKAGCITNLTTYNPGPLCLTHARDVWSQLLYWLAPKDWYAEASCARYVDMPTSPFLTEVFSRDRHNPTASHSVRKAKAICAACPVRRACLEDQLALEALSGPLPGIRGGTLPEERRYGEVDELLARMDDQAVNRGLKEAV